MSVVDYSKWDALSVSSDDEADEPKKPIVHRLEPGSRITIPGRGKGQDDAPTIHHAASEAPTAARTAKAGVKALGSSGGAQAKAKAKTGAAEAAKKKRDVLDYSKWDRMEVSDSEEEDDFDEGEFDAADDEGDAVMADVEGGSGEPSSDKSAAAQFQAATPEQRLARFTRNGSQTDRYLWCQCERTVTVHVLVPAGTRAADVVIRVNAGLGKIEIAAQGADKQPSWALAGDLYGPIEDTGEDEDMDWQVQDLPGDAQHRRTVSVTLTKKDLAGTGLVVWWKSFIKGDPEITSDDLQDRSARRTADAQRFSEALAQAEAEFKRKPRDKIEV